MTVLLVVLCARLPIGLSYYLAWRLALDREQSRLGQLATLSLRRTETAFDEAHGALLSMADLELRRARRRIWRRCAQVLTSHYIVELGYFQQRRLRCTSWGHLPDSIPQSAPDFVVKAALR